MLLVGILSFSACGGKKGAQPSSSKKNKPTSTKAISDKGNSLYYYLVSELQAYQGSAQNSLFYLDKAFKKDSSSSYLALQKAYELAHGNKLDGALELALKVYEKHPDDVELNLLLGKICSAKQFHDKAVIYYNKAIKLDPKREDAYQLLARQYLSVSQVPQAIATLEYFLKIDSGSLATRYFLANIYTTEKEFSKALRQYEILTDLNPDDPKIYAFMGEVYLAQKDYSKALDAFLKLKQLVPSDMSVDIKIALLYYEQKDFAHAIEIFQGLHQQNPKADRIIYYLGILNQEAKNTEAALSWFAQMPSTSDLFIESVARQALLLKNDKKLDEAISVVNAALAKKNKQPSFYDMLSSLYASKKEYQKALDILKTGLAAVPHNEQLYFVMGVTYEKMGQWKESIESMKKVLEANPSNVQALNFVGYTYAEQNMNLDEALSLVQKALQLKPGDGFMIDSLGWVYFRKGNIEEALIHLEKANKLTPKEPTILEHLGDVYLFKKDKRKALSYFEQALFELGKKEEKDVSEEAQIRKIQEKIGSL